MRTSISLFVLLVLASGLQAGQLTIVASPRNLTGWTLVGAEEATLSGQTELTLPAQAQLVRSVSATSIVLELITRPDIGENAEDWPVLELGAAALVFSRSGQTGRLTAILGNQPPVPLAFTFPLDPAGRSLEILTVRFTRDDSGVSVTMAGQTREISSDLITEQPMDIVLSAGASQSWVIRDLKGLALFPDPASQPSPLGLLAPGSPVSGGPVATRSSSGAGGPSPVATPLGEGPVAVPPAVSGKSLKSSHVSGAGTLEVYTPSAVRHGRAQAVRAAVQGQTNK